LTDLPRDTVPQWLVETEIGPPECNHCPKASADDAACPGRHFRAALRTAPIMVIKTQNRIINLDHVALIKREAGSIVIHYAIPHAGVPEGMSYPMGSAPPTLSHVPILVVDSFGLRFSGASAAWFRLR